MENQPPILIDQNNNKVYLVVGEENENIVEAMEKLKDAGYEIIYVDSNEELGNIVDDAKVNKREERGVGLPIGMIGHNNIGLDAITLARLTYHEKNIMIVGAHNHDVPRNNAIITSGGLQSVMREQTHIFERMPDMKAEPYVDYKKELGKNSGGIRLAKYVNAKKFKRKKKGKKTHRKK